MAILGNTVVNGSLRCLNKIYAQDLAAAGTTSFANLAASGTLSVTGNTTLTTMTATGTVTLSKTQDLSGTANSSPALIVGGTASQAHLELDADEIHAKGSGTTTAPLYLNNDGGIVYLSNGSASNRVYANNGMLVSGSINNSGTILTNNINVTNTLRATNFDLQTVASVGGALYVSPTAKYPTGSSATLGVARDANTGKLTLTITDPSITNVNIGGIAWGANSRVKISGTINGVVTGTMDGTITSINTSSHVMIIGNVEGGNHTSVPTGTHNGSNFSDLSVMIYQRNDGSTDYRVGIWINCYDIINNSATLRIYGGTSTLPNVMLGNLTSAGLGTVNNMTPTGWGLFAQNAFLHGVVVATAGSIGGFELEASSIKTAGVAVTSNANDSIALSSVDFQRTVAGGEKTLRFAIGSKFGVSGDGAIYASGGQIGGFTIGGTSLTNGTWGTDNSVMLCTGTSGAKSIGGSVATVTGWAISAGSKFGVTKTGDLYANSATITGTIYADTGRFGGSSGFTVAANKIYKTKTTLTDSNDGVYIGTDGIAMGANSVFKVTSAGALTATSGEIGGWSISTAGIYTTLNDYECWVRNGAWNNDFLVCAHLTNGVADAWPFYVHTDGSFHAEKGDIGGWNITSDRLHATYNGYTITLWNGSNQYGDFITCTHETNGVIDEWPFWVQRDGTFHATKGSIGGWQIGNNYLYNGNAILNPNYIILTSLLSNDQYGWELMAGKAGDVYKGDNYLSFLHREDPQGSWTRTLDIYSNAVIGYTKSASWQGGQLASAFNVYGTDNGTGFYGALRYYFQGNSNGDTYTQGYYATERSYTILYAPYATYAAANNYTARWIFNPDGSFSAPNGLLYALDYSGTYRAVCCSGGTNGSRAAAIGTNSSNQLSIHGQFGSTSAYSYRVVATTTSDIRLKENIKHTSEEGLPLVKRIDLCEFDWKTNGEHKSIGFIADELEKLNPELVFGGGYAEDGSLIAKGIDHLQLIAYLTKAIQEQQDQIDTLKKRLKEVESR